MTANPTFASCWTQLGLAAKVINEVEKFGSSNTPNLYAMEDALVTGLDGEYTPALVSTVRGIRNTLSAQMSPRTLRENLFRPAFIEMGRAIGIPEASGQSTVDLLVRIRKYMHDNSQTLLEKEGSWSAGSPSAGGGNVGDGTLARLTVDKDGYDLSTGTEAKRFECIRDQGQVRKHSEVFEFRGGPRARDLLDWEGSGARSLLVCKNAKDSGVYVQNPSFDQHSATSDDTAPSSLTGITGWTIASSAANYSLRSNASYVYRDYPGAPSTSWGLEIVGDDTISQVIKDQRKGLVLNRGVPFYVGVKWKRLASATGTLTFHCGSQSVAATIGSATNDVWNTLVIAQGTASYYDNFLEDDLDVKMVTSSIATGTIAVDDLMFYEYSNLDGTWYVNHGGATPYAIDDVWTLTDTAGTRGILAYLLWLAFGADGWLPTASTPSETISDPS